MYSVMLARHNLVYLACGLYHGHRKEGFGALCLISFDHGCLERRIFGKWTVSMNFNSKHHKMEETELVVKARKDDSNF